MLTDDLSPLEKIAPKLCGMKASFEQYLKKIYAGQQFAKPVF